MSELPQSYINLILLNGPGHYYSELGGYFAGVIDTRATDPNGLRYLLIVAPKEFGECNDLQWKIEETITPNTCSKWDGLSNTNSMNGRNHPAAYWCKQLRINDLNNWYLPAIDELELLYRNFKPNTTSNYISLHNYEPYTGNGSGYNPSSDPTASSYTFNNPNQTSVNLFKSGNSEAFTATGYWSSTEYSSILSFFQGFTNGYQNGFYNKTNSYYVRAVRRLTF
jgi:hypothetical protein